jgi:hypothetical protein
MSHFNKQHVIEFFHFSVILCEEPIGSNYFPQELVKNHFIVKFDDDVNFCYA